MCKFAELARSGPSNGPQFPVTQEFVLLHFSVLKEHQSGFLYCIPSVSATLGHSHCLCTINSEYFLHVFNRCAQDNRMDYFMRRILAFPFCLLVCPTVFFLISHWQLVAPSRALEVKAKVPSQHSI